MAFNFRQVIKRTGQGTARAGIQQAFGVTPIGFDPTSLAVSAGVIIGSWGISTLLRRLSPQKTLTIDQDLQLAGNYPFPHRIGTHQYAPALGYATAREEEPDPDVADSASWNTTYLPDIEVKDSNILDLGYHLGEGRIETIYSVFINGQHVPVELARSFNGGGDIYRLDDRHPLSDVCYVRLYNNGATLGELVRRSRGQWRASYRRDDQTFAVVTCLDQDDKKYGRQIPEFTFSTTGIQMPDLARYSAADPDNPYPETAFTNNAASVYYWVLTTWPGGPRLSPRLFDHRSVVQAYLRCGELLPNNYDESAAFEYSGFPTHSKRFSFDGTIEDGEDWDALLLDLDLCWLGSAYFTRGLIRFAPGDNIRFSPHALHITQDKLLEPAQYQVQPPQSERFNSLSVKIPQSQPHFYQQITQPDIQDAVAYEADNRKEQKRAHMFRGIVDPSHGNRLATQILRGRRLGNPTIQVLSADPQVRALQPGEGIFYDDAKMNLSRLPCVVRNKRINQDGSVLINLKHFPPGSFSDEQRLPQAILVGGIQGPILPPTEVTIAREYKFIHGTPMPQARVSMVLDRPYDYVEVRWYEPGVATPRIFREYTPRGVLRPTVVITDLEPNTLYHYEVVSGALSGKTSAPTARTPWNSGDDETRIATLQNFAVDGIVGGVFVQWDQNTMPYYDHTELSFFVGTETEARFVARPTGESYVYSPLPPTESQTVRVRAVHVTKSEVRSLVAELSDDTLLAASEASGFLGLTAFAKALTYNNFQSSSALVNANGCWGMSKALSWANVKTLKATDSLYLYQSGSEGVDESAYLSSIEVGDYITIYLTETQTITFSVSAAPTRTNVGTVDAPRYRYQFRVVALSDTLRERPVPILADTTRTTFRFSRAVAGADGEDGKGFEWIFCTHDSDALPSNQYPDNSWGYDQPGTVNNKVWTDGAQALTTSAPYLFQSQRKVDGAPADGAAIPALWTTPVVVSRLGLDGSAAMAGDDGRGVEYVFRRGTSDTRVPATPANTRLYDWSAPTDGWSDGAPSLDAVNRVLWGSVREVPGLPATDTAPASTWGNWTTPTIVGTYGERGAAGSVSYTHLTLPTTPYV